MHTNPQSDATRLVFWSDMMAQWRQIPARSRIALMRQLGSRLHALWQARVDLRRWPVELTAFQSDGASWFWRVPERLTEPGPRVLPVDAVRAALTDARASRGLPFSARERAIFLRHFLKPEGLYRDTIHQIGHDVEQAGTCAP